MKFARYKVHGNISYGVVNESTVTEITTTPFERYEVTDHTHRLSEIQLLSPCIPSKIVAIGLNYSSHLGSSTTAGHFDAPNKVEPFLKTPSSLIGPGDDIVLPEGVGRVDAEAELVVVIGTRCKKVSEADAPDYVFGYTCGNDVSARVWQKGDLQWWRAKSSDTFAPLGPYLVTDIDGSNLDIRCRINGDEVQHGNTSELIFGIPTIISTVSQVMTLEVGDIIMTGTPGIPGELKAGGSVDVEIDEIGLLMNPVKLWCDKH